jgi:hypothetical protein
MSPLASAAALRAYSVFTSRVKELGFQSFIQTGEVPSARRTTATETMDIMITTTTTTAIPI